jgi:hypothetical protein
MHVVIAFSLFALPESNKGSMVLAVLFYISISIYLTFRLFALGEPKNSKASALCLDFVMNASGRIQ